MASSFCIASQALCRVLAQFPDVNASLQSDCRAIIRHRDHNIGGGHGDTDRPRGETLNRCFLCHRGPALGLPQLHPQALWKNASNQPFIARLITQACHCSAHGLQYYFLCSITRFPCICLESIFMLLRGMG